MVESLQDGENALTTARQRAVDSQGKGTLSDWRLSGSVMSGIT